MNSVSVGEYYGKAASQSSSSARIPIFLVFSSRLAKVHMHINKALQL